MNEEYFQTNSLRQDGELGQNTLMWVICLHNVKNQTLPDLV